MQANCNTETKFLYRGGGHVESIGSLNVQVKCKVKLIFLVPPVICTSFEDVSMKDFESRHLAAWEHSIIKQDNMGPLDTLPSPYEM